VLQKGSRQISIVPYHKHVFAIGFGSTGCVVETSVLYVSAVDDNVLVVMEGICGIGSYRDASVHHEVKWSNTGLAMISLVVDHYPDVNAALLCGDERLCNRE